MTTRTIKTSWDGDPLMYPAFIGCVCWALTDPDMMQAYRSETGDAFVVGANPIDRLIDEATGADFEFCQRFSDWVEQRVFGHAADAESAAA